jgi:hypothetical protein
MSKGEPVPAVHTARFSPNAETDGWRPLDDSCAGYALVEGLTYGAVIANPVGWAIGAGCAIRGAYVVLDSIK